MKNFILKIKIIKKKQHKSQHNLKSQDNLNNENQDCKYEKKSQDNTQSNNIKNYYNIDFENMSEYDRYSLELLSIQFGANMISIASDIVSLNAVFQGIRVILERNMANNNAESSNNNAKSLQNDPDVLGLKSVYLNFAGKLIFTYIGFERYKMLIRQKTEGTLKYSLRPNIDINTANILGILANCYTLKGAYAIVDRSRVQSIFGI